MQSRPYARSHQKPRHLEAMSLNFREMHYGGAEIPLPASDPRVRQGKAALAKYNIPLENAIEHFLDDATEAAAPNPDLDVEFSGITSSARFQGVREGQDVDEALREFFVDVLDKKPKTSRPNDPRNSACGAAGTVLVSQGMFHRYATTFEGDLPVEGFPMSTEARQAAIRSAARNKFFEDFMTLYMEFNPSVDFPDFAYMANSDEEIQDPYWRSTLQIPRREYGKQYRINILDSMRDSTGDLLSSRIPMGTIAGAMNWYISAGLRTKGWRVDLTNKQPPRNFDFDCLGLPGLSAHVEEIKEKLVRIDQWERAHTNAYGEYVEPPKPAEANFFHELNRDRRSAVIDSLQQAASGIEAAVQEAYDDYHPWA